MRALLLTAAVTACAAATPPAFTGRWRLDLGRSDFGGSKSVPRWRQDELVERGDSLTVHSVFVRADGDTTRLAYRYRPQGEARNTVSGLQAVTRGVRDGRALRFVTTAKLLLAEIRIEERWSLSPDGVSWTIERVTHSPLGNQRQKLVFARR